MYVTANLYCNYQILEPNIGDVYEVSSRCVSNVGDKVEVIAGPHKDFITQHIYTVKLLNPPTKKLPYAPFFNHTTKSKEAGKYQYMTINVNPSGVVFHSQSEEKEENKDKPRNPELQTLVLSITSDKDTLNVTKDQGKYHLHYKSGESISCSFTNPDHLQSFLSMYMNGVYDMQDRFTIECKWCRYKTKTTRGELFWTFPRHVVDAVHNIRASFGFHPNAP